MPSQINRVPPGLLSLLDIKSLGQNPALLSDSVAATIDLLQFYLGAFSQSAFSSSGAVASVGTVTITSSAVRAGAGELIIVESCMAYPNAALGAGTTIAFAPTVINSTTAAPFKQLAPFVRGTAGLLPSTGANGVFAIPPGFELAFICNELVLGVAPTLTLASRFVRLVV